MIKILVYTTTTAALSKLVSQGIEQMLPFLIAMVVIVLADLKFGTAAARYRGEVVRMSGAIRRTINKLIEYLCWITVAITLDMSLGHGLGIDNIRHFLLVIVFGIEIQSCLSNYMETKGKKIHWNPFKKLGIDNIEIEDKKKEDENN